MVWFKSAAVFLLISLNENAVASDTAEGIAAGTVNAEGPAATNPATLDRKARAAHIPAARRAKRRKPISHAYKNHVKPYTPNARKLQQQGAAGEEVVQNGYVYDTKATIHKPAHKPVPYTYTKGKGYVSKGYVAKGYVEYEYEYPSKAMMSGGTSMKNAASYYDYEYYGYDTYGAKGKGVYYEYRSKAMMSGGGGGGGGGAYYDYEYYGYDEYGMPIAPEMYPPYHDHAKYPYEEHIHMPEKKPAYDDHYATEKPVYEDYATKKPVYDEHYATIKPGYDDHFVPHDDMYKKPTPGKGYYYYEVERSKAMMKSSKSKMAETITYYYEYPMYMDDHYAHEVVPPKHPGGGVVPPPFAGPPGSGPPVSSPTAGGSPAPAGGGGGETQCFDDLSILIAAVDQYIADPSPDSALADTYGFPIGQWCVNGVTEFGYLFSTERSPNMATFNENLSTWDVSSGVDFYAMFEGSAINQDFSSWDMSRAEDMGYMFSKTSSFQGTGLANWDVSSALDTSFMFQGATAFNADISSWNIGASLTTRSMFQDAVQFNQDLSGWSPVSVDDTTDMFNGTSSFSSNLCSWGTALKPETTVIGMFAASGCPVNEDPDLDATPPGPLCFAC